ncbi:MAG: hypothetical protein JKY53_14285 [Flavobacteriales bacterium]|nr:hypothetical protein [Flavobacteriales bacterium]
MRKQLTYLFIFTAITFSACKKTVTPSDGQADKFTKIFGNYGLDVGSEVYQTRDDGYIFVGTITTHTYGKDIAVIKTDKFGNEEWSKVYGDTLDDFGNSLKIVGNEYIVLGTTTDTTLSTNIYLLKLDALGNEIWSKTIGTPANEEGNDIIITSDNGFAILGSTTAEEKIIGPGGIDSIKNPLGSKDFYFVKTDANGNIEWAENYGANKEEFGTKVIQKSDGGYVIMGSSASFEDSQYQSNSILAIVVNENGAISGGFNTFGGSKNDFGNDIVEVSDGFIILGTTSSFSSSGTATYVAKSNSTLTDITWETSFGGGTSNDGGKALYIDEDENIIIGGFTDEDGISKGLRDQYLFKLSPAGTLDDTWGSTFGGSGNDIINSVYPTTDGGFVFIGTTDFENNQMISLTKVDSEGKLANN